MKPISFFNTYIDKTANENVSAVLDTTFLSEGKLVKEFEKQLQNKLCINNIVTVNSGTSSLHLAFQKLGLKSVHF